MRIVFISILFIFLVGCEKSELDKDNGFVLSKLEWLYDANPQDDLLKALKVNDYRFIGFNTNGIYIPHVSKECINIETQIKFLSLYSHGTTSYEHEKLVAIAEVYARVYNQFLYIHLTEADGFECDINVFYK